MTDQIDIKRRRFTPPKQTEDQPKAHSRAVAELQGFSDDVWEQFRRVKKLLDGFQPLDTGLTSLSALPTTANRTLYSTADDVWAETPLTAFIRTLLDDADAPTARATLGITGGSLTLGQSLALANGYAMP